MSSILRLLPSVPDPGITGIIDILVVAFLVYQALMVVRGTRAGHYPDRHSHHGVALRPGRALRLEALRSLLSFIVPYLGLAVIVLFQSEIRRTLARLGRKRWFGGGDFHAPEVVSEILLALEQLAEHKIGALIVLERDIGLRTFIESGVRLDAQISRDLLISIFQPGLPLHDGAVIVQRERLAAAACFLPLTTNPALSASSARATARPSGSPRKPTACRWWCPRRRTVRRGTVEQQVRHSQYRLILRILRASIAVGRIGDCADIRYQRLHVGFTESVAPCRH